MEEDLSGTYKAKNTPVPMEIKIPPETHTYDLNALMEYVLNHHILMFTDDINDIPPRLRRFFKAQEEKDKLNETK